MIDVKYCFGCRDDFYNGKNSYGVQECWSRKSAKLVKKKLIPIDLRPPYLYIKTKEIPNCYYKERYSSVAPENLDTKGYWK